MTVPDISGGWAAVILAGGTARRWGGRDKTAVPLAGRPVLRHVVDAVLPEALAVAVVAPEGHPARRSVTAAVETAGRQLVWTREDPPGGGPCAAIAAGVHALADRAARPGADPLPEMLVVLAGDLPFARTAWPRLLAALAGAGGDVALGLDPQGQRQPLLAAYRTQALRERLAHLDPAGQPLRLLLAGLTVVPVRVSAEEALDLDTPADAVRAEEIATGTPGPHGTRFPV